MAAEAHLLLLAYIEPSLLAGSGRLQTSAYGRLC